MGKVAIMFLIKCSIFLFYIFRYWSKDPEDKEHGQKSKFEIQSIKECKKNPKVANFKYILET